MTYFEMEGEKIPEIIVLAFDAQQRTIDDLHEGVRHLTAAGELLAAAINSLTQAVDAQRTRIVALEQSAGRP